MINISKGSIITGFRWPEPVEVELVERVGEFYRIVGATVNSRQYINDLLRAEDFEAVSSVERQPAFTEEPWKVFLALETKRYRFASLYDPLLAMNASKVDPLPHQIEAVYGYVLKLPRIRFLIADDPGAGKTIMAGLIIKEMKFRNLAKRILIVTPGHLKDQWRRELSERFEERFRVVDRNIIDSLYGENIWLRENQLITSMDFAKRDEILPSITAAEFDLIIVDEAHKMSAYRYGEKLEKTERYKLGERLSKATEHLLFLTATPHRGDSENFRLFLDLLEPGFFATNEMLQESITNQDNPLFIRRIKEDLKDFEGKPLFLPRYAVTRGFELGLDSPREKELYNDLSEYVNTEYNRALSKTKKRNVAFALVILQRRFASSTYALLKSLERRKKRLESLLKGEPTKDKLNDYTFDLDEAEEMSEEDRWKQEEVWETLSVAENREELQKEILTIDGLILLARDIIKNDGELKLKEFRAALDKMAVEQPAGKDHKILVFTESRDTLEHLVKKLNDWGYRTNYIHGGMKLEDRIKAESIFRQETQILVATEAAGEGINLQFCNLMINYDIPWNPNRLEQRLGRIHRYGQQREVFVYNLVAVDTREGKVLEKLFEKLEEIRVALGSDKVFDVLSEVLMDRNLSQLLVEAAATARNLDDILKELDITIDAEYVRKVKENLGESLATRYIDYTRIREMALKAREYRLIPEYTECFFKRAFVKAGGKIRDLEGGFSAIDSIPHDLKAIAEEEGFKKVHVGLLKRYPKVTFDKDIAFRNPDSEFISFGHPIFESIMTWVETNLSLALANGATFRDPDNNLEGYISFYEGEIKDGSGKIAGRRLFALLTDDSGSRPIAPSIVWDLVESETTDNNPLDIEILKQQSIGYVLPQLESYQGELLVERLRQAEIKEKYGIKSLDHLILRLDGELIDLYDRRNRGENVDLVIRNKEDRKDGYEKAMANLKDEIQREKSLVMGMPRFVGAIHVMPLTASHSRAIDTEPIELAAVAVAMEYERRHGREPEDVGPQKLGFDIRSRDAEGNMRYIEVKGKAASGSVELTINEWFKARRFRNDYYLFAVMNALTNPELYIIQNPAENLQPQEKIEIVRFVVPLDQIKNKGDLAID